MPALARKDDGLFANIYTRRPSHAPARREDDPKPAPRLAAQPKQWHRGKYQDALMAALERDKLTPFEVVVGFALSKFADKDGECFPSIQKIARKVGAKADKRRGCSCVSRALSALKREGLIEVDRRYDASSIYMLRIQNEAGGSCSMKQEGPAQRSSLTLSTELPPLTESENSHEERADNRQPIVLDDEMRKIAVDAKVDDWAIEDQFNRLLTLNENIRLYHPKAAWKGFCERYKRPAWLDWEGFPQWCPELWTIAIKTFPDVRAAERHFLKALKRREMRRKGKSKPKPVDNIAAWWKVVCKAYVPEEPAPRRGSTIRRPESKHNSRRHAGMVYDEWNGFWRKPAGGSDGWEDSSRFPEVDEFGRQPDGEGGFVERRYDE